MTTMLAQFESSEHAAGKCCKVALLGFGTVGSCVARLLAARSAEYPLQLTHICNRNVARKRVDWTPPQVMWTEDIHQVLSSDADVIVELVGGLQPAYDWVRSALQSGKSVVTANKQLIAHFGSELLHLACLQQQFLGFGACVAGGVPVLSGLQDGLAGDRIIQIRGILNGTCNYILTRIEQAGTSFAEALAEAQRAGFAEPDPTDDVEGLDAGAKLAILARVGLNVEMRPQQVPCHSIRPIAASRLRVCRRIGMYDPSDFHGKTGSRTNPRGGWSRSCRGGFSSGQNLWKPELGDEYWRIWRRHGVFRSRSRGKSDCCCSSFRPSTGGAMPVERTRTTAQCSHQSV